MNSNYFEEPHQRIGFIDSGSKTTVTFKAKKALKIEKIETSCGCTSATYKKLGKKIVVKFTAEKVPIQVNKEFITTTKSVTVTLKSGRVEILTFTADITK